MTTIEAIREATAHRFDLTGRELLAPDRTRRIVHPRQLAMLIAREETGHSLPAIAYLFGLNDHTTVIHAIKACRERIAESQVWAGHYACIKAVLG